MRKGELVYVPSEATLYKEDSQGSVTKVMKLSKPANLLILEERERAYQIFLYGEKWLIRKDKTYEVKQ